MQPSDGPRSRTWILGLLIAIALIVFAVRSFRHRDAPPASDDEGPRAMEREMPAADEVDVTDVPAPRVIEPPIVVAPVAPVRDVEPARPTLDLHSAEATVETAATLLREGRDDEFILTFLPAIRPRLTPRALERCRARVVTSNTPLRPDWEVAEETTEDGHRVRRVSMYGHETTGFHEIDGQWLADRAWCVPTDVPDDA